MYKKIDTHILFITESKLSRTESSYCRTVQNWAFPWASSGSMG